MVETPAPKLVVGQDAYMVLDSIPFLVLRSKGQGGQGYAQRRARANCW
jgi:hypothetical protein